jgi:hypothetical protein
MTTSLVDLRTRDLHLQDLARGFSEIGYHYVVERDGNIGFGRTLDQASIHDDFKLATKAISVIMVGGAGEAGQPLLNFTDEQWDSLFLLANQHEISRVVPVGACFTQAQLNSRLKLESRI